MKRFTALALLALALPLITAPGASAQLLDGSAGDLTPGVFPEEEFSLLSSSGYPFAVGGGTALRDKFAFSAHLGPNGPSGYAVFELTRFRTEVQGPVVCYQPLVPDTSAVFSIEVKKANGRRPPARFLTVRAVDSGAPGGSGDTVTFEQSPSCLSGPIIGGGAVIQGNIVVQN